MTTGERDLNRILKTLAPELDDPTYVFVTLPAETTAPNVRPLMQFTEDEGQTLILDIETASTTGLAYEFPCRRITLTVHSALDAAGMIAVVATALAKINIPVNPVAGFYHDHLFVPEDRAEEAMAVLHSLGRS